MTLQPDQMLSHYRLVEKIGEGGMGTVWKAVDTTLDRELALKLLPEELAGDEERLRRFDREARILASLNHPNVATIYGLHEAGGLHFLTMELIPGEDLARRLTRGRIPVREAIPLLVQVAEALEAAHQRGVIHRDLKPANIQATPEGRVKVLDFGLAKEIRGPRTDDATSAPTRTSGPTGAGMLMGTTAYMSPEQARGRSVDARTDIWAFGCVVYEILTGAPPFRGETLPDKLAAVLKDEPRWDALPPETLAPIRDLLRRCLEKAPGDRLPDISIAKEILTTALASISPAVSPSTEAQRGRSIAVLPFTNISPDPENEYFSDGITEEIINALAHQKDLRVAARTSCFSFKGKHVEIAEVGAKLKVGTVLEGSVRRVGNRVRITAQLINVADGYHLWSERFDRELHDVFKIQDETAAAIVEKLRGEFAGGASGVPVKRYTRNREAHDMYLKGRFHWNRRHRGGIQQGLQCFRKAAEIDPGYALAHVGIADVYWSLGAYALHPLGEALSRGREAVERALVIDEGLPDAHATKGAIGHMAGEWAAAEESFRRAIELDPRHGFAHVYYALLLAVLLRVEEMQEQIEIALEVDPLSHYHHGVAALASYWAGNHEEAIRLCRKGFEIDPEAFLCSWVCGATFTDVGQIAEGIRYCEKAVDNAGRYPLTLGLLGYALGRHGQEDRARELLAELERRSSDEYVSPAYPGMILLGLGDRDLAHEMYVRAMDEGLARHILVVFGRPFPDLLRRCGIPEKPGR